MNERESNAVAAYLCGCKVEDLLKVREDNGGLVVIVASGAKHVFTAEQVEAARLAMTEVTSVTKPSEVIVPGKVTAQIRAEVRKLLMDDQGHLGEPAPTVTTGLGVAVTDPKPKPKSFPREVEFGEPEEEARFKSKPVKTKAP